MRSRSYGSMVESRPGRAGSGAFDFPGHADVAPLLLGRRQLCMGRADGVEPGMNLAVQRRSLTRHRVHMQVDLLAGRNDHLITGPAEAVKQMNALVIDAQQLRRDIQALQGLGLGEMADM